MKNTAKVKTASLEDVAIEGTSECLEAFLDIVRKETSDDAAAQVRDKAAEAVTAFVKAHTAVFGPGEVGAAGSGRAIASKQAGNEPQSILGTTGLLYGKVQSGKTNACIATVALAAANGFRCFVVLTSDNTLLGTQTFRRFRDQLSRLAPDIYRWSDWNENPEEFGKDLARKDSLSDNGVVFISTKNKEHLASLAKVLKAAGARNHPGLVVDDEADHASLNGKNAKNARAGGGVDATKIFELIGRIRELVPHHIYLQVTATPQSLLLQTVDHPCKPVFCVIVDPGTAYVGGDTFFTGPNASRMCVEVDPQEFISLRDLGRVDAGDQTVTPDGLRSALCSFFVGATAKQLIEKDWRKPYSMLVHLSQKRNDHGNLSKVIRNFVTDLDRALRGKATASATKQADRWLAQAYEDLKQTAPTLPPLDTLRNELAKTLRGASAAVINADNPDSEVDYKPGMNILIGGNRLGRGVTIEGLMVTYYGRDPKTRMTDTVHQHARMFGYRNHLLDVTRFFSSRSLIEGLKTIHEGDEAMREAIGKDPQKLDIKPVWVGKNLKATRSNVLNPAEVGAIATGRTIYPPDPLWKKNDVRKHTEELDKLLAHFTDDSQYLEVPIDFLLKVLEHMPSTWVEGYSWEDARVAEVLKAMKRKPIELKHGRINVRRGPNGTGLNLERQEVPWSGFTDSRWVNKAKLEFGGVPTLIVTMEAGEKSKKWDGQRVYLPTLVLPKSKFVFLFNYT